MQRFNIFYNFIKRRHFWRYATFSEIAELYISRTLRVVAMYIASGFTTVFLYKQGYSLQFILICWASLYFLRCILIFLSSFFIAKVGPKHGTLISNLLYIPAMVAIGLMPGIGMAGIVIWVIFGSISSAIYQLCYVVDFSKVKNVEHAGKEIAFMNIFDKVAIGLSPILGGLIALIFSPQVVMIISAALFAFAAGPLLKTSEPVKTQQKIDFRGFPWRMAARSMVAQLGVGFDVVTTGVVWGLFVAIVILSESGKSIYLDLGILSSVSIIVAIFASYAYGKLIDKSRGGLLLVYSVIANSIVHLFRSVASVPSSAVGVNVTNELATAGYNMAYLRGEFDTADLSGHRIVYLCAISVVSNLGALIGCLACLVCILLLGDASGMRLFFVVSAVAVLIIGTANFRIYRK